MYAVYISVEIFPLIYSAYAFPLTYCACAQYIRGKPGQFPHVESNFLPPPFIQKNITFRKTKDTIIKSRYFYISDITFFRFHWLYIFFDASSQKVLLFENQKEFLQLH